MRFLAASGERHEAAERRVELLEHGEWTSVGALVASAPSLRREVELDTSGGRRLDVAVSLTAHTLGADAHEVALRVENRSRCPAGLDRAAALGHALLSTHPILRVDGGRFISPLDQPCASVNTFPVLAGAADDAVIGATIVLPDHPQLAPESRGGLFDSTEIEEALLLHVKALSDGEREQIERHDPAVREMVARAAAATPEEILALHGRVTLRDPDPEPDPDRGLDERERAPLATTSVPRSRVSESPPQEPPACWTRRLGRSTPRSTACAFVAAAR